MFPIASNSDDNEKLYVDDVFNTYLDAGNGRAYVDIGMNFVGNVNSVSGKVYTGYQISAGKIAFDSSGNKYELFYLTGGLATTEIIKTDSSNTIVWARTISESGGRAQPQDVQVLPNGNIIVLCYNNRSTFDYYAMLTLFDSSGNILWHKGIENGDEYTNAVKLNFDSSSNIYVIGSSGGTANFVFLHKINPNTGALIFQKRFYVTTTYYSFCYNFEIDGSDIWMTMSTQSTQGGQYDSKLIKLTTSGTIVYKKSFVKLINLLVDSTYIYAGISDPSNSKISSIIKLNKSDLSVVLQKSFKHRNDVNITLESLFGGYVWVSCGNGAILKLDSSFNIVGKFAVCKLENKPNISEINVNVKFNGTTIHFNGGYTGGVNSNFSAIANYDFTTLTGKISSLFLLYSPTITSIANVTTVSISDDTTLNIDNDSCTASNSTASFGTTNLMTVSTFSISENTKGSNLDSMFWFKRRDDATQNHLLTDTITGLTVGRSSNSTAADISSGNSQFIIGYTDSGYIKNSDSSSMSQGSNVGWTFRKAAKFFDVVTATSVGGGTVTFNHNLGGLPGMVIIKATASTEDWYVYHRSMGSSYYGVLNTVEVFNPLTNAWTVSSTSVSYNYTGGSGKTYVAYLFAHDTSSTGIIQCGSFTTDGSGNATVNLGWEPQYLLAKTSGVADDWYVVDSMRGFTQSASDAILRPNTTGAEANYNFGYERPTATGFEFKSMGATRTYIYMAIRRPNKPPTSGTQVFVPVAQSPNATLNGTKVTSGIQTDMVLFADRNHSGLPNTYIVDRLKGYSAFLATNVTNSQFNSTTYGMNFDYQDGTLDRFSYPQGSVTSSVIYECFKRAPGFFDEVCYTGTGSATTEAHNLGVVPELVIQKNRTAVDAWETTCANFSNPNQQVVQLNTNGAILNVGADYIYNRTATSVSFSNFLSNNGSNYVAYLFATLAGISKVGSYTGNGSSQNIECGFAAGARFVLIKRTDSTGDWYVWDSARGIVSGNDPHLSLNSTAAEVTTDDSVDPYSPGFTVNQLAATNINVTSATYIYLAVA